MNKNHVLINKAKLLVSNSHIFSELPSEDDPSGKFTKTSVLEKLQFMDDQKLHKFILMVEDMNSKREVNEIDVKQTVKEHNKNSLLNIIKSPFGGFGKRK